MEQILSQLRTRFPQLNYREGSAFYWSPESQEIFFIPTQRDSKAAWALLHETSHALLGHTAYKSDVELLQLEVSAWERAKELAASFGIRIDEDHVQDCLDSYRDWMYARCICPLCGNKSLQQPNTGHYQCFNCHTQWRVTKSRFCRAYRYQTQTTAT